MTAHTSPRGLLQVIIHAAAERLSQHAAIPPGQRADFRQSAVRVFEQQVCAVIGSDSIRLNGWVTPPSERLSRKARIMAALQAGEQPRIIAARELVSAAWVRILRAELARAAKEESETNTP